MPGINKHFAMALVSEKLCSQLSTDQISSEEIWCKLKSMFDLNAVDDREEVIPFTLEEREFCLPKRDFNSLIVEKQKEILKVKFPPPTLNIDIILYPRTSLVVNQPNQSREWPKIWGMKHQKKKKKPQSKLKQK